MEIVTRTVLRSARAWAFLAALLILGCGGDSTQQQAGGTGKPPGTALATQPKVTSKTGVEMVLIPAGEFIMGDNDGEEDESPAHSVRVAAFYMDVHEVTQESHQSLMGKNPAKFKNPRHPVEQLGWFGAISYCNMRSLRENLTPCYDLNTMECNFEADGYRLPTESEWEYACRAQSTDDYSYGDRAEKLSLYAWFEDNAGQTTHPVGKKNPNAWGLYDMHGNVSEWCQDYYEDTHYQDRADSEGWNNTPSDERVLRGGSWANPAAQCRSSARLSEEPGLSDVCFGYDAYGFRCVRRSTN
jgi:formylglycine-generating enzyme required for sulfatase activity